MEITRSRKYARTDTFTYKDEFVHVEFKTEESYEESVTLKFARAAEQFVKRKSREVFESFMAARPLRAITATAGMFAHANLPFSIALGHHITSFRDVREEIQSKFPITLDHAALPLTLQQRARYISGRYSHLSKLFQTFADTVIEAHDYYINVHQVDKIQLVFGKFPQWIKEKYLGKGHAEDYEIEFCKKADEVAEQWIQHGGNPKDPAYVVFVRQQLTDWPSPGEVRDALKHLSGPCVCTRTPAAMSEYKNSFGFSPSQIVEFHPTCVEFQSIWQAYQDFENGNFHTTLDFIQSIHTIQRLQTFDAPEFTGSMVTINGYSQSYPFYSHAMPGLEYGADWLDVDIATTVGPTLHNVKLPAQLVYSKLANVPSCLAHIEREVVKELDPSQEVPMIAFDTKPDGSLVFIPERLVKHGPEFAWVLEQHKLLREQQKIQ